MMPLSCDLRHCENVLSSSLLVEHAASAAAVSRMRHVISCDRQRPMWNSRWRH